MCLARSFSFQGHTLVGSRDLPSHDAQESEQSQRTWDNPRRLTRGLKLFQLKRAWCSLFWILMSWPLSHFFSLLRFCGKAFFGHSWSRWLEQQECLIHDLRPLPRHDLGQALNLCRAYLGSRERSSSLDLGLAALLSQRTHSRYSRWMTLCDFGCS